MVDVANATGKPHAFTAPHAFYVTGEDYLRLSVLGSGTQVVAVTGRFLTDEGEVKSFDHRLAAPGSRTAPATLIRALGCGWLENITAIALSAGTGIGQSLVTVDLVRGPEGNGGVLATLLQGPVSSLQRLAWPGSALVTSLDIAGVLRSITGTNPALGVEISEAVPAGARWRLRGGSFTLVTDGTVVNREVTIVIDDGANILYTAASGVNQTATQTRRYSIAVVGAQTAPATATDRQILIPDFALPANARIRTVTTGIVAGDDYGAPQLLVEESLEGA